jgi:apolipoprotein N-acyltransferase
MARIILSLLSALLLILSFPTFDISYLAWFGLVPLFLAIRNQSLKSTLGLSFMSGMAFFMGVFFWINAVQGVTLLHYLIMGLYLGLYFFIFGFFLHILHQRDRFPFIITGPALWVCVEYLRSHVGAFSLPLALLGHTQHQNLPLLQMASFTGAYGVSFLVVLVNSAIADLIEYWIEKRRLKENKTLKQVQGDKQGYFHKSTGYNPVYRGIIVVAIVAILWVAGYLSLPLTPSGKSISVSVVQGNISQEIKWKREYREHIISKYELLSEEASKSKPQLIVWPEASTPGFILGDKALGQRMVTMTQRFNTYLLAGSAEYPKFGKKPIKLQSGNTALFFSPEGKVIGQYLKIRLVPFGEHVPYEGSIPWPEFLVSKGMNSDLAGTELVLFGVDGIKFGTLICSEMMYPELSRGMVKKGAEFLVNISNEGWFGKSSFPYQFLSVCVFRAVENRVNLVRSTNTGISCFIDPYGRILAKIVKEGQDIFVEGTLSREIRLLAAGTFYTRHGDVFAYGCIVFTVGLVIWLLIRGRIEPLPMK